MRLDKDGSIKARKATDSAAAGGGAGAQADGAKRPGRAIRFVTGRRGAWVTLLLGLIFAGLAFGPLRAATTETTPTDGLPADTESVVAAKLAEDLPGDDASAAVLVYRTVSGEKLSDEQIRWIQGEFDPNTQAFAGGVTDRFLEFSNLEVMGSKFVPPATISENGTTAVITVPVEASEEVEVYTERVAEMRGLAVEDIPAGLEVYLTGPEGFLADISQVFAGADFTLLLTTVIVVAVLLLVTYRSPILWLIPLLVVGTADGMAGQLARQFTALFDIYPDASVTGILSVLVFGAGTNYALLLIARYREELLRYESRHDAMAAALRGAGPAIVASGSTVVLALLTLGFASLEPTRALGLACAAGIVVAMVAALVVLPAALAVFGRWIFWPFVPKFGGVNRSESGIWAKLGKAVSRRPAIVSVAGVLVLGALAAGGSGIQVGLASTDRFLQEPDAVKGQKVLAEAFPAGSTTPALVMVKNDQVTVVADLAAAVNGVAEVKVGESNDEYTKLDVVLDAESQSDEAYQAIVALREAVRTVPEAEAFVGGIDAQQYDVKTAYANDQLLVIPLILLLVFIVLILLLRAFVAPVLLLTTVVASFFASMGAGWLLFQGVFGFPALDLSVFLFSFLFLVALGVDYNIFLVTRAKEEAEKLGLKEGMIKALATTGGVITSAGILLAAVFAVLGVLPLVALAQIGVIVCIGVLLDTLLVRTVVVPALAFMTKQNFWWPRHKNALP